MARTAPPVVKADILSTGPVARTTRAPRRCGQPVYNRADRAWKQRRPDVLFVHWPLRLRMDFRNGQYVCTAFDTCRVNGADIGKPSPARPPFSCRRRA